MTSKTKSLTTVAFSLLFLMGAPSSTRVAARRVLLVDDETTRNCVRYTGGSLQESTNKTMTPVTADK